MKRVTTLLLALALMCTSVMPGFAAEITDNGTQSADTTVRYGVSESYIVTVPDSARIDSDGAGSINVSISNALLASQAVLNVYISSDSYTSGYWNLTNTAQSSDKLQYQIKKNGNIIANDDIVLSVIAGEAWNTTVSATLALQLKDSVTKAGTYQDTLTFTVEKQGNAVMQHYGTYMLTDAFFENYVTLSAEEEALLAAYDMGEMTDEEMQEACGVMFERYGVGVIVGETAAYYHNSNDEHVTLLDAVTINGCSKLLYSSAMNIYCLIVRMEQGESQGFLPVPLTQNDLQGADFSGLPLILIEQLSGEKAEWWNTVAVKVSDEAMYRSEFLLCMHDNDTHDYAAVGYTVGSTWQEVIDANEFSSLSAVNGYVVCGQGSNGQYRPLKLNGRYVRVTDKPQYAQYEAAPEDMNNMENIGAVYTLKNNITPVIVPDMTVTANSNTSDDDVQEELQRLFAQYQLAGFEPIRYDYGNVIIRLIGLSVCVANDENATPFFIIKTENGGQYGTTIGYAIIPPALLNDTALEDYFRYFNINEDIPMSEVATQWLSQNAIRVQDSTPVHGAWLCAATTLVNVRDNFLAFVEGMTWGEVVEGCPNIYISADGYICQDDDQGNVFYLVDEGRWNNPTDKAPMEPMKATDLATAGAYGWNVCEDADGNRTYYCHNCGSFGREWYNRNCGNPNCTITEQHASCCCGVSSISHLYSFVIYYKEGMTWRQWMNSEHYGIRHTIYIDSQNRLVYKSTGNNIYVLQQWSDTELDYVNVSPDDVINGAIDYDFNLL